MILKLCNASDLPPEGTLKAFKGGGFEICVARCDGRTYAFQNSCPHQGAPLCAGQLDGSTVICPYHAWRFSVTTGHPEVDGDPALTRYVVRQFHDEVFIQLPGRSRLEAGAVQ